MSDQRSQEKKARLLLCPCQFQFLMLKLYASNAERQLGQDIRLKARKSLEYAKNAGKRYNNMNLKEKYQKEIVPEMMKKYGYKNPMAVPRFKKVVINTGFGKQVTGKTADEQKKVSSAIIQDLALICGQKPVETKAKKAIASFKTRQGMTIGASCTLRNKKMYDFIERFINISLPRSRDFRGLEQKSFDKKGNLAVGIKEQIIFPEILPEKIKINFGLEIIIDTTAKTKEEGINFLKEAGFPIK